MNSTKKLFKKIILYANIFYSLCCLGLIFKFDYSYINNFIDFYHLLFNELLMMIFSINMIIKSKYYNSKQQLFISLQCIILVIVALTIQDKGMIFIYAIPFLSFILYIICLILDKYIKK